jgi:primosomal protein N' (replication factor Y)
VYAQTWAPDQPVFALLKQGDYAAFAAAELQTRELLRYPPYDRLVALWCLADTEGQAETAIKRVADRLGRVVPAPYRVVGPAPAPMRRLRRQHRWQLLLKTARVGATLERLDQILTDTPSGKARFNVDVDPVHLL